MNSCLEPQQLTEVKKMQEEGFEFEDSIYQDETLSHMSTMRKEGQFCDAILEVDGKSIRVHRIVLASSNVFFFEFFSSQEEKSGRRDAGAIFKLDEYSLDYNAIQQLINYFYSARITCTFAQVWSLYEAAMKLKVVRVAEQCSRYLVQCLTPQNCLGTYRFALMLDDKECLKKVAEYIQNHISDVLERSLELSHLPSITVDVTGSLSPDFYLTEQPLCKLVVSWLHDEGFYRSSIDELPEHAHNLILTPDNKLIDGREDISSDQDPNKYSDQEVSKHFEKRLRRNATQGNKSPLPHFSDPEDDSPYGLVASTVIDDKSFICLAAYNNKLAHISIKFHSGNLTGSTFNGGTVASDCDFSTEKKHPQCLMTQLTPMTSARCGFGVAVTNENIIVIGGYGRGECMSCVESYSLLTNSWKPLKPMHKVRGRFSVGVLGGKLVACGGSDGASELSSVEAYDPVTNIWSSLPDMIYQKSSAGVAVCGGKLYVIGGLSGSKTLSHCEVFDPLVNKWQKICPLNTGRSQAAVCSYLDDTCVVALGGCNAWNCMNSCEAYDPSSDSWTELPTLAIARRGSGAAYFKGMLYVIGGSDAQSSLTSVEIFNPQSGYWFFGPSLAVPRANMGVTVFDNSKVVALGGYSGKSFLKSLEYLAHDSEEWCSFLPADIDVDAIVRSCTPQARRKMKNGHRNSTTSDAGSSAPSETMISLPGHEALNGSCNSDSELSSTCSVDEFHREHLINNV